VSGEIANYFAPRARRIYRLRRNARGSVTSNNASYIMQRRPDGKALFENELDFRIYLSTLRTLRKTLMLKVYRYCLMTNHVHLIVDPGGETDCLRLLMASLANLQAPHLERPGQGGKNVCCSSRSTPIAI